MATVLSILVEMMVLVGDLLALVAAGASLLALIGEYRQWQAQTLRQIWSNGLVATVLVLAGLAAKLASGEFAQEVNGYLLGFDDQVVGVLLLVALVASGAAYLVRRNGQASS